MTNETVFSRNEAQRNRQACCNAHNKAAVLDALSAAGITEVTVEFDGDWGFGQITGMTAQSGGNAVSLPEVTVELSQAWCDTKPPIRRESLKEAVAILCFDYLRLEHSEWTKNDGAIGMFTFDVAKRTVHLDLDARLFSFVNHTHTF